MGLLDDLKQQADSVLVQKRTSAQDRTQKLEASDARMKTALQYWVDFFKALNVVKPEITRNYNVEGSTQLANLVQTDYNVNSRRLSVEHHDYIDSIELRFRCVSNESVTIEKDSDILVNRYDQIYIERNGVIDVAVADCSIVDSSPDFFAFFIRNNNGSISSPWDGDIVLAEITECGANSLSGVIISGANESRVHEVTAHPATGGTGGRATEALTGPSDDGLGLFLSVLDVLVAS